VGGDGREGGDRPTSQEKKKKDRIGNWFSRLDQDRKEKKDLQKSGTTAFNHGREEKGCPPGIQKDRGDAKKKHPGAPTQKKSRNEQKPHPNYRKREIPDRGARNLGVWGGREERRGGKKKKQGG